MRIEVVKKIKFFVKEIRVNELLMPLLQNCQEKQF
jgi:hypothetical protein